MDSATARQISHCRTSRLVVFRKAWSGPKTVVSRRVRMDTPPGFGPPGIERVEPEPFDPAGGLGRGQAVLLVHPLRLQHLIGPQRVPDRSVFAWR